jgi:hypothetical protein
VADGLAIDVHDVLAWAQVYLHAGQAALASRTPAGDPVAGATTRCDAQVADRQGADDPGGGAAGTEGGQGGGVSPPVTFSAVAGPRADLDRVRQEWQDIVGPDLAAGAASSANARRGHRHGCLPNRRVSSRSGYWRRARPPRAGWLARARPHGRHRRGGILFCSRQPVGFQNCVTAFDLQRLGLRGPRWAECSSTVDRPESTP